MNVTVIFVHCFGHYSGFGVKSIVVNPTSKLRTQTISPKIFHQNMSPICFNFFFFFLLRAFRDRKDSTDKKLYVIGANFLDEYCTEKKIR